MSKKVTIVHTPSYADWVFTPDHPTQGRRFTNAYELIQIPHTLVEPRHATIAELSRVHSPGYIAEVTKDHTCFEWPDAREDLATFATLFAGGTLVALEELISGRADVAIHLPGAKHHAQYDHSSGFCVFADFALAADIATKDHGLKVAILDIDAHHGDGTENLTANNPNVLTFSIHEDGIFPGTGHHDYAEKKFFNHPLSETTGKGDLALLAGVNRFIPIARAFSPDLLFIAAGADGLSEDPLTNLHYSVKGYADAAQLVAEAFAGTPILMGGAGGYLPDTGTPNAWSAVAHALAS